MKQALLSYAVLFAGISVAAERLGLPEPVIPDPFGVNIHFVVPNEAEADSIAAGGFKFVRMDFGWGGIERKKGEYDFSGYDKLVDGMSKRGIREIFILDYGNDLYDKGASPFTDEGRAAFAKFAGAAAAHFAGKNILWEIWNEPNISFWKPKPNVEDYASLALVTIEAVRKADPDAFIQGPASSTFPWEYFERLGERGVLEKLDAVSVHPYRQLAPETVIDDYLRLRGIIDRFSPKKHIPIVSGEWGFSTVYPVINGSDSRQAKFLVREWLTNLMYDVRPSIWYDWRDDGTNPKDDEHHFGTVFHDMKPKPAYTAAQVLCNTLRGYRYVRRVALDRDEDYALLFVKGEDAALAMWTTGADHTQNLATAGGAGLVYMMCATAEVCKDDVLKVELSDTPQYVMLKGGAAAMGAFWRPRDVVMSIRADSEQICAVDFDHAGKDAVGGEIKIVAEGVTLGTASFKAEPGKSNLEMHYKLERRDRSTIHAEVVVTRQKPKAEYRSPLWLKVMNAVQIAVLPPTERQVPVKIENPSGEALELTLKTSGGEGQGGTALKLKAGEREGVALVPIDKPLAEGAKLGVDAFDGTKLVARSEPAAWRKQAVGDGLRTELDGDAKIAATAKAASAAPPEAPPGQQAANALEISYRFDAGWRFLRVPAPDGMKPLDGSPQTLGMWLYGDGSGNLLRCRFTDKTGQTFQPDRGAIDWKGWRFVMFDLNAKDSGHWGGANDGVIHFPIRLDTLVLIDSTQQKMEKESKVFVTGMAVK